MIVFINKDGFLESDKIFDANIELEITDETWNTIAFCKKFHNWRYQNNCWNLECIDQEAYLRDCRESQCFKLIDSKSTLWYNNLTEEQLNELNTWYKAWLDVTETKIIPEKISWLK